MCVKGNIKKTGGIQPRRSNLDASGLGALWASDVLGLVIFVCTVGERKGKAAEITEYG